MILAGLEIDAEKAQAMVRVNDVPVGTVGGPDGGRAFLPATLFIVSGENWLTVDTATFPAEEGEAPKLLVRIAVFQEGDQYFTEAGRELVRVQGGGGVAPIGRAQFYTDFGPVAWSWMRCLRWSDAEAAMRDARHFVGDMLEAFANSDADWFAQASGHKFADSAEAFPALKRADIERIAREEMSALPVSPISRGSPAPVLCGSGRLLQLLSASDEPLAIKPDGDGSFASLAPIIGKLDGKWQIFR